MDRSPGRVCLTLAGSSVISHTHHQHGLMNMGLGESHRAFMSCSEAANSSRDWMNTSLGDFSCSRFQVIYAFPARLLISTKHPTSKVPLFCEVNGLLDAAIIIHIITRFQLLHRHTPEPKQPTSCPGFLCRNHLLLPIIIRDEAWLMNLRLGDTSTGSRLNEEKARYGVHRPANVGRCADQQLP